MKILSKKKQKQVCQRITANAIIAYSLLDDLLSADLIHTDKLIRYTKAIIDNTAEAVGDVGGVEAMFVARDTMARYHKAFMGKKENKQ